MAITLRCLARVATKTLFRTTDTSKLVLAPTVIPLKNQIRNNNTDFTRISVEELDESKLTDFEISKDPNEWKCVERVLPIKYIPKPKVFDGPAPSGWVQPEDESRKLPYFVIRSKNHMQPVYLQLSFRLSRKITVIKRIQGNIWEMEKELKAHLMKKTKRPLLASRVHELAGKIIIRGDYVALVKQWMDTKGF